MKLSDLSEEEREIALAVRHIRQKYEYKFTQLMQALGREPTATEMMDVAGREINMLHRLRDLTDPRRNPELRHKMSVPPSLLVQTFLTKVRRARTIRLVN